jgi:diguanylate cyclase (GGDEF)-like protein
VLRIVAATLKAQVRLTDLVARWGGEEFLAILPGPLAAAIAYAERARAAIQSAAIPGPGSVTISVGVAEVAPDEAPADAIARADERLHSAKRAGRNRVEP